MLGIAALSSLGASHDVYAVTSLDTWCSGNGGYSSYSGMTCTVTDATTMSTDVTVSNGEALVVVSDGIITISSGFTLTVNSGGVVTIQNSGMGSNGIVAYGSINNSGTINVENSGPESAGIYVESGSTLDNYGTIVITTCG